MKNVKAFLSSPYMIAILFMIKMMVYYSLIKVNYMQLVLIMISLSIWAFIFVCFSKSGLKRKRGIFLLVYVLLSLVMFADTMYYNYYHQTVSIRQLWQVKSVTAVPKSFIATLIPSSFLLFVDIPFTYHYFKKYSSAPVQHEWAFRRKIKYITYAIIAILITVIANPFHSTAFERVNSMEFFTSHFNDIYETITEHIATERMDEEEILEVLQEVNPNLSLLGDDEPSPDQANPDNESRDNKDLDNKDLDNKDSDDKDFDDKDLADIDSDVEDIDNKGDQDLSKDGQELPPAQNTQDNQELAKHYGIGRGKNLIVIQLEAFQEFVINREYEGQEITPNLNKLLERDTIFFDRYYSNTGKGNTADAEFTSMNSLYPLIDGEIYRLYEKNTFRGLPWLLKEQGYDTFVVHGFEGEFWNRENAYPYQGFNDYISMEDLEQDEIIGMGISDKSVFRQLSEILKVQKEPYFSFVITLTNHHPYVLEEQFQTLELKEEDQGTAFGSYLQTVRYTDEAIGQFIDDLKAMGLYDNTVIALYGDHHGLNCGMEENQTRMTEFLGKPYDYDEMLNVPLIIHVPGSGVKEKNSITGGQIDFMPTISNIMGIDIDDAFIVGQDLVNAEEGFVAFTTYLFEGSFVKDDLMFQISREGIFEGSRAWNIETGQEEDASLYKKEHERALLLKKISKEILEQNLIEKYTSRDEY
ncbi:MAG: LTA synthase family protein [Clostridiales bacterium]|nr:LTA synthase family protein [Clostridiales bacterium]